MMWPRHIELIKSKFKHTEDLLLIFLYKEYVFGVVSKKIPELRLPQITVGEMEQVLATPDGEANLEGLLAARCIFTPDKAAEVRVTESLKDDAFYESVITKDEIRQMIEGEIEKTWVPKLEEMLKDVQVIPPAAISETFPSSNPSTPSTPYISKSPKPAKPGKQLSILDRISEQLTKNGEK